MQSGQDNKAVIMVFYHCGLERFRFSSQKDLLGKMMVFWPRNCTFGINYTIVDVGMPLRALLFPQYLIPTENSGFSVRDGTQRSCISRILKLRGEELLDKH